MICLVRDKKIPFAGFPIDVKNVDVIGCKASNQIKNKKIRKKRTPNSKYSGSPVPNSPRICLGKIWNSTKEKIEIITPVNAAVFGYGIYKGRLNLKKVIDDFEEKLRLVR